MNNYNVLNSFEDAIAIINSNGEIIFTNEAWQNFSSMNGAMQDLVDKGTNYIKLCLNVKGKERGVALKVANGIKAVISEEMSFFEIEYPCHSPYEKRWFILRANLIDNKTKDVVVSHINITATVEKSKEIDKKRKQLVNLNKQLERAVYRIAHDIQGPLNSMKGLIGLTKMPTKQVSEKNALLTIDNQIEKLSNYIKSIVVDNKIIESKADLINWNKIVNDVLQSLKHIPQFKKTRIEKKLQLTGTFYQNNSLVFSCLINCMHNSLKYCDKSKKTQKIEITVIANAKNAIININDNGIGIDKEKLKYVFKKGYRVSNDKNGGGKGLYLISRMVKEAKGKINISSSINTGTTIKITLPNVKPN